MTTTPTPTPNPAVEPAAILDARLVDSSALTIEARSQWQIVWRRFRRHRLGMVGLVVLVLIALAAVLVPYLSPYTFDKIDTNALFQGPSWKHPFGTGELGQDEMTRVLLAGRVSLLVGFMVALMSAAVGLVLGLLAGYFGGGIDSLIARITDMFLAVPALTVIIAISLAFSKPGLWEIVFLIFLFSWMQLTRIVRGSTLSLKERDFVQAARASGASHRRIIFRHILPNAVPEIIVFATLTLGIAILVEAAVSFLGFGIDPARQPSWGNLLQPEPEHVVFGHYTWLTIFPGLFIVLTVLAVNFLGDGLRDALDPHGTSGGDH